MKKKILCFGGEIKFVGEKKFQVFTSLQQNWNGAGVLIFHGVKRDQINVLQVGRPCLIL